MDNIPTKEYRNISTLRNWDKNPRSITKDGMERLKTQLTKLGQYKPLLITPDGEVLGGNMRLRAYQELGVKDLWVSVVEPKNESEKLEYALSDNDRAGFYDDDLLANLTAEMPDFNWADYSVDLKEPTNLGDLLDSFKEVVEDKVPEVSDEPAVSKLGEVYQLGRHRLMCGDSTKIEDVEKLMNGQKADMVFTDPPYGMDFDGAIGTHGEKRVKTKIINDSLGQKDTDDFLNKVVSVIRLFNKGSFYITYWRLGIDTIMNALTRNGLKWRNLIIWRKNNFNLSNSDYKSQYEPIVYGWSEDYEPILYGWTNDHNFFGRKGENDVWELPTVWDINKTQKNDLHSTMKPQVLCARAILNSSKPGKLVMDLFGGSGSTLIACEQTNRTCYMMELDPRYCDVIRKRYAKFIGKEAEWQTMDS